MEALRCLLCARNLTWHEGPVFNTPAFMAEKWEDVLRWQAEGYAGVEMEAATTYAIAAHFGVPAACLLYLLDNLIEERAITHNTAEERARILARRALVEDVALALATGDEVDR
jgi:purine-nucleoside phosphorylase